MFLARCVDAGSKFKLGVTPLLKHEVATLFFAGSGYGLKCCAQNKDRGGQGSRRVHQSGYWLVLELKIHKLS